MNCPTHDIRPDLRRRSCRGEAMLEFVGVLPILLFIFGMAAFLGIGLNVKEGSQVEVRQNLWEQAARHGWWHHYNTASRSDGTWTPWDPFANGNIGSGTSTGTEYKPRGTGEELDYLYSNAGDQAMAVTGNAMAEDYYRRVWNNLCGRHFCESVKEYRTGSDMFKWLDATERGPGDDRRINSPYYSDSPTWVHGQIPLWLIAQYGPMVRIRSAFETHLAPVPQEFRRMAKELLHAWFEEEYMVGWNNPNAVFP